MAEPVSCEVCRETMEEFGEEPDCSTCKYKQPELLPENILAYNIWAQVSLSRPRQIITYEKKKREGQKQYVEIVSKTVQFPLDPTKIIPILELYEGTREDYDKVLIIEEHILKYLNKQGNSDGNTNRD